jgi:hypothetical protein
MRESSTALSGVAIQNMYSDAIDIISELQGNYTQSLRSAIQMAISVAAFRRYPDFTAYTIDSFKNDALNFEIKPRVLFGDSLSMKERLELTNVALDSKAPELMLKALDYDKDDIAMARREQSRAIALTVRTQATMQSANNTTQPTENGAQPQAPTNNQSTSEAVA